MTVMLDWLTSLGLEQYASLFLENEVDLATVQVLTDADLKELGLPFGPRKRVLSAVRELNADPASDNTPRHAIAGATAVSDGERRQLTVLFCDMVGFTNLASRVDPEVLQLIIRRYEDVCAVCITRYEGYVFQRLGDGIVAFFGFPLAHEGEAERAARAGLEIVETLSGTVFPEVGEIHVRIGIATGVVVVSAADRSAVGETMNLAARLQGIAQPDQIVVSAKVHRLAGGTFDYVDLGEQALKGIPTTSRAYRVQGISQAHSRFEAATQEGMTPIVGREHEIGALLERWHLARSGRGQMAILSGEAGIGKSRTVSALRECLETMGAGTMHFQCSPFHVNSAFHPSIDALERALRFGRDDTADAKLDKLESLVVEHFHLPREDVRFIADVLSIPSETRFGPTALSARRRKEESMRALVDLTELGARAKPTVLLFEDAHWADPSSLELLDLLVDRLPDIPLLVLLTHRPEFRSPWSDLAHVTAFDLSRLKRAECRAIIVRLADGKALPEQLVEEIIDKADGVPLFVEEVTKAVLESGDLTEAGDRYVYSGTAASMAVPATLRDSLMARLDRVTVVKEISQIGSAIGREFSYELLAAVSPMNTRALADGLVRLTDSGLAFRRGTIPDATFTFKHALVQDAAYDSLLKSRRQELHAAIGRVLEASYPSTVEHTPELLARHFTAAGLDAEAVGYWRRAGESAFRRMALPEAISHLRAGLACLERLAPGPSRDLDELSLRTLLGPAVIAHRGWAAPEVSDVLERAWNLAESLGHVESYLPVLHGLWVHHMSGARLATSIGWAEKMLDFATSVRDENLELNGRRAAMASYFWKGELLLAREHGDTIRAVYDEHRHGHIAARTNSDPLTADGIYRSHYLWMLGYPDQARAMSQATADHARRRKHPFDLAFALTLGAQSYEYCGDHEQLLRCAEEAERVGREYGVPLMSEIMAEISKGEAWLLAGRLEDGTEQLRESAARLNQTGHRVWIAYLDARRAEMLAQRGDVAAGLALVNESLARRDCQEDRVHLSEMLRLKALILQRHGQVDAGEQTLHEAIAVARAQHAKSWELRATTTLARLLAQRDDPRGAHAVLAPVYDWFTEGFDTKDLRAARHLLQELAE